MAGGIWENAWPDQKNILFGKNRNRRKCVGRQIEADLKTIGKKPKKNQKTGKNAGNCKSSNRHQHICMLQFVGKTI